MSDRATPGVVLVGTRASRGGYAIRDFLTRNEARGPVGSLLPGGAEVYNNTSQTIEAIGVASDIERSGRYRPLRLRLYRTSNRDAAHLPVLLPA